MLNRGIFSFQEGVLLLQGRRTGSMGLGQALNSPRKETTRRKHNTQYSFLSILNIQRFFHRFTFICCPLVRIKVSKNRFTPPRQQIQGKGFFNKRGESNKKKRSFEGEKKKKIPGNSKQSDVTRIFILLETILNQNLFKLSQLNNIYSLKHYARNKMKV